MTPALRDAMEQAAITLAATIKAGDADKLQTLTIAQYARNFAPTAYLVKTTAARLTGDTLKVTQIYALNAQSRKAGDTSEADFSCPLSGSTSETDFAIPALPPGEYGFAMVEASGQERWLLAFLMEKENGAWKMAGFFPKARSAAGHDGLWFWKAARDDAKTKELWSAWVLYGEADRLLRPADFVSSTNLDKLRQEEHAATPPELADGLSAQTPLVLKTANGKVFRYTDVQAEGSDDGRRLNLVLHYSVDATEAMSTDVAAARARNIAAAKTLLDAHKSLREGFDGVRIFSDTAGHEPFATEQTMAEIP